MAKSGGGSSDKIQFSIGYPKNFTLNSEISDEVKIEVVHVSNLKKEINAKENESS